MFKPIMLHFYQTVETLWTAMYSVSHFKYLYNKCTWNKNKLHHVIHFTANPSHWNFKHYRKCFKKQAL